MQGCKLAAAKLKVAPSRSLSRNPLTSHTLVSHLAALKMSSRPLFEGAFEEDKSRPQSKGWINEDMDHALPLLPLLSFPNQ